MKNVIQNYIVKYDFKKLVELSLQVKNSDFHENDRNEKFLKLIRDKFGLEKFMCMLIDGQRDLQKAYFSKKRLKKMPPPPKSTYETNNANTITSNKVNTPTKITNNNNNTNTNTNTYTNTSNNSNIIVNNDISSINKAIINSLNAAKNNPVKITANLNNMDMNEAELNANIEEILNSKITVPIPKVDKPDPKVLKEKKRLEKEKEKEKREREKALEREMKEREKELKAKMKVTYEDLNKEITDILNGTATKMNKKKENIDGNGGLGALSNSNSNIISTKPLGVNDNNIITTTTGNISSNNPYTSIYRNENKNDTNSMTGNNDSMSMNDFSDIQSTSSFAPLNNTLTLPNYNAHAQMMSLGLSVHLHKDDSKRIFKYYLHHIVKEGLAAYYCSDKRCNGSAKYYIDTKKFEISSDHNIQYENHCYVVKPFPNDQRLFKEFAKRNFSESQLIKQNNGRSNIFWYNN